MIMPRQALAHPTGQVSTSIEQIAGFGPRTRYYLREMAQLSLELARVPGLKIAALLILPYAGVLVGLDVAGHYGALTHADLPVEFNLASDGSFSEWLEYSLTSAVAVMLFLLWRRDHEPAYLANAALFVYLTLDNSLEFHEHAGAFLGAPFAGLGLPVEPHHLGEAVLFGLVGIAWLAGLAFSVKRAAFRPAFYSLLLAACIGVAAVFGVFVDLAVVWGPHSPMALEVETFVEDGGEFAMIILAFLITVAIFDTERKRAGITQGA